MEIQNTPTLVLGLPSPTIISLDDEEYIPNFYNLKSRKEAIAQSVIETHLMPILRLNTPNNIPNHGYASADQELQIKELSSKIQANHEAWLTNSTIEIDDNTNSYFAGSIINDNARKPLEFCELIEMDKYCTVRIKIFYDELVCLAQVF